MSFVEIQNGSTINARDKDLQEEDGADGSDLDTFDADGPNRLTIWVPTERVALNLGAAVFGSTGKQEASSGDPRPEIDAGFVAQTNQHIHFHTFGVAGPVPALPPLIAGMPGGLGARTIVRLGTPTKVVTAGDDYASTATGGLELLQSSDNHESVEIGSAYSPPYNAWDGYAMLTEGGASHESLGNHLISSGNADVRIAGRRAVMITSPGYVHIRAAAGETVGAELGNADPTDANNPFGAGTWVTGMEGWLVVDAFTAVLSDALAAFNAFAFFYWMEQSRPPVEDKPGWKAYLTGDASDKIGDLLAAAGAIIPVGSGFASAFTAVKTAASPNEPSDNTVSIYGSDGVNITSSFTTTVHGLLSATLSGTIAAAVSSTATTSVSSLGSTSVSGTAASLTGLLTASVSSPFGSVSISGKSKAAVTSWGRVFVQGNDQVQINSADSIIYLHGKTGFYLACGSGDAIPTGVGGRDYMNESGWGILGDIADGLKIGKFTSANYFATPAAQSSSQISVDDNSILLTRGKGSIKISDDEVLIGPGLGSGKIHLG